MENNDNSRDNGMRHLFLNSLSCNLLYITCFVLGRFVLGRISETQLPAKSAGVGKDGEEEERTE